MVTADVTREELEHEVEDLRREVERLRGELDRLRAQLRQVNDARFERPPHYR